MTQTATAPETPDTLAPGQVWRNPDTGWTAHVGELQPKDSGTFNFRGRLLVGTKNQDGDDQSKLGLNPWDVTFLKGLGYTEVSHAG